MITMHLRQTVGKVDPLYCGNRRKASGGSYSGSKDGYSRNPYQDSGYPQKGHLTVDRRTPESDETGRSAVV